MAEPALAVFLSSAVAGFATAPIAAAHFNAIAQYGLLANLASVPLMGVLVIPAAVVAAVLAPLGLEAIGLWVMSLGVNWILYVAHFVAGLPQARTYVVGPAAGVVPLLTLGFLTLLLWRGRLRWIGAVAMVASFIIWSGTERPDVLIADTGALVGVMTEQGRALSKAKGAGFVADNWLENDGDGAGQTVAAARWQEGSPVIHLSGKRAAEAFTGCVVGQLVVSSVPLPHEGLPCVVHDPDTLRETGAVAYRYAPDGTLRQITARAFGGDRLWTQWPEEKPRDAPVKHASRVSN